MSLRRLADRFVVRVAGLLAAAFFRRVEVVGAARIPPGRPLLLVGNHVNSLIDPLLLLAALPVTPRFLAKSTLWKNHLLRPLLVLAGAVPVYRRQDEGVDPAKNLATFARCHELLARGGAIALFPEGTSHSEPGLVPLRTGAARIVLEAEERFGPLGTRIVPVGLVFDDKQRFRSRVLVEVGEPVDPAPEVELYRTDPQGAARALTARLEQALRRVTVNYGSWKEAALIGRAADLFARPGLALPVDRSLAEESTLHRRFIEGYEDLRQRFPERTARAAETVEEYARLLETACLTDEHVAARYPMPSVLRLLARSLPGLALAFPFAMVGTVLNWVPYRLAGWISRKVTWEPDVAATYKLYPSLLLFPAFWLAEAGAAGWAWGLWAGALVLVAAPLLGWIALRFNDRRRSLAAEARAYWLLATRQRLADELRRRRRAAHEQVMTLAELAARPDLETEGDEPAALS